MDAFVGKWRMETSDNFDDYMKAVGVSLITRKVASSLKPSYVITTEPDGTINLRTESTFKNNDMKFKLGEQFQEQTTDGRTCQSTIKLEGKKLIQEQKGEVNSLITRELTDNDTLTVTLVAQLSSGNVTSTRVYKRDH